MMKPLPRKFYMRSPDKVAEDLLGNILVRKIENKILTGKIVETEAYFGRKDPASRAHLGRPKYCVKLMHSTPGKALIYAVHANWLFNIVAHERGKAGAVLIRAVEPLKGIEIMKRNRSVEDIRRLCRGPGCLTQALAITKEDNGKDVTNPNGDLIIVEGEKESFEIGRSHRIGVSKDLHKKLRFYVKGSKFVS